MFNDNLICSSYNGEESLLIKKIPIKILAAGKFKLYKLYPNYLKLGKSGETKHVNLLTL